MTYKSFSRPDSPEKYIRTRARNLPLGDCYINSDWEEAGMAFIIVTRRHKTGNLTFGIFQVDLYCLGVKDAFWRFNEPEEILNDIMENYKISSPDGQYLALVDYPLAHNIIYGALDFAEDLGFRPHKDFNLTQYILEDDEEDNVDFIDIQFGMNGIPAVITGRGKYPLNVYKILDKSVGEGNYIVLGEGDEFEEEEDDDDEGEDDFIDDDFAQSEGLNKITSEPVKPMNRDMMNLDMERLMDFVGKQNFSSIEEANAFFEKNLTGRKVDEIIPKKKGRKSNEEKADDLMYQAYESDPEKGVVLAGQALELDPESIRAYNYLAQHEPIPAKAFTLFEKAAQIAQKQLGEEFFRENKGHFWGLTETRPYMTARAGMAECMVAMGKNKEGIKIFEELLKLNPNDNQGVRYELSYLYLVTGKFDQYHKLYRKNNDEVSAFWLYNYAYFIFQTQGPGSTFEEALIKAYKSNKYVIKFMAGKKKLPDDLSEYYSPGQPDEAAHFLMDNLEMWIKDLGLMSELVRISLKMKW